MANREKRESNPDLAGLSLDVEERLLSEMDMKVYEIAIHGRELRASSIKARTSAFRLAGGSILLTLVVIVVMTIRSLRMSTAIIHRAKKLRDFAVIVGSGNLSHRVDSKGDDELAEVTESFNEMTVKLNDSYQALENEIAERKQAEEALVESERRFRTLITASSEVIYEMSPDWSEMRNLSGGNFLADTEETNRNWLQEYIHPDDQSQVKAAINEAVRTKSIFELEHRVFRADGTLGWTFSRAVPLLDSAGQIIEWFGAASDVTARKQAEEALQTLNNELEKRVEQRTLELQETQRQYLHVEKLSAVGKLSASIAHEFNNPLQSVMTVLKGLKRAGTLEGEEIPLLDLAIGEIERMKNLIRNLSDFNRPTSGRKVITDLNRTLESVLLLMKNDLSRKGITVLCNYEKQLPQIMAVPDQIKQVILNLLTNAADACKDVSGEISISTWRENEKVAMAVKDTGIGIKNADLEHIFRPFFTTKAEVKGTGLGLSISYGIIKNHQGEIKVESEPGKGSTFTVLLPFS